MVADGDGDAGADRRLPRRRRGTSRRRGTPAPTPKATPAPSGSFDTSGNAGSRGSRERSDRQTRRAPGHAAPRPRGGRARASSRRSPGWCSAAAFRSEPAPRVEAAPDGRRRGRHSARAAGGLGAAAPARRWPASIGRSGCATPRARMRAAVELLPAASPTLLPVGLPAASGRPRRSSWARPAGVALPGWRAPSGPAGRLRGTHDQGHRDGRLPRVLARVAERLAERSRSRSRFPGPAVWSSGKSAAFFSRLPTTVARLEAARAKGIAHSTRRPAPRPRRSRRTTRSRAPRRGGRTGAAQRRGDAGERDRRRRSARRRARTARLRSGARPRSKAVRRARSAVLSADRGLRRTMARDAAAVDAASRPSRSRPAGGEAGEHAQPHAGAERLPPRLRARPPRHRRHTQEHARRHASAEHRPRRPRTPRPRRRPPRRRRPSRASPPPSRSTRRSRTLTQAGRHREAAGLGLVGPT